MIKLSVALLLLVSLAGCGSGSGSSSNGGSSDGGERGDITDRPISSSDRDFVVTVVQYVGDTVIQTPVAAFQGFPIEFFVGGHGEDFLLESIQGCGGVRKLYEDDPNDEFSHLAEKQYETINNVSSNCTVTAKYKSTLAAPLLISVDLSGYGVSITPETLSVTQGQDASFFVDIRAGYTLDISGCSGTLINDVYRIANASESCSILADVLPTSGQVVQIDTVTSEGTAVEPSSVSVNAGEVIEFQIESGFGFNPFVSGCEGIFVNGVYQVIAQSDCTVSVDANTTNDSVVTIESNEPVYIELYDKNFQEIGSSTVPLIAVSDEVEYIDVRLKRPSTNIITSANGCTTRDIGPLEARAITSGVVSLSREYESLTAGCTLTLETEFSEFKPFNDAKLSFVGAHYQGEEVVAPVYYGTASQHNLDVEGFEVAEALTLTANNECRIDLRGSFATVYHPQRYLVSSHDQLCPLIVDLQPEGYDPR